jgi:hypothetical protein
MARLGRYGARGVPGKQYELPLSLRPSFRWQELPRQSNLLRCDPFVRAEQEPGAQRRVDNFDQPPSPKNTGNRRLLEDSYGAHPLSARVAAFDILDILGAYHSDQVHPKMNCA